MCHVCCCHSHFMPASTSASTSAYPMQELFSSIPSCAGADYDLLAANSGPGACVTFQVESWGDSITCPTNPACNRAFGAMGRACFIDYMEKLSLGAGTLVSIGLTPSELRASL